MWITHHSDEVNLKVLLTHLRLDVHESGLGNRLGVHFEALFIISEKSRKVFEKEYSPHGTPPNPSHHWPS